LKISFYFFSPSFPGSSSSSRPFQFLSEDLSVHPILLHSLQVTQPTYPLPLYPFYYIFTFTQLFQFSSFYAARYKLHILCNDAFLCSYQDSMLSLFMCCIKHTTIYNLAHTLLSVFLLS
jgi:hypothetical protein